MKSNPVIAICGATGVVGSEMINVINQRKFPTDHVKLFASENSAGELYEVLGNEVMIEVLDENSFEGVDIALFATGAELSKEYVPCAVEAGAFAVDNSSYFRMHENIPLVVPEVNPEAIKDSKIIANPNCSTIQLMPVLSAMEKAAGLERVVVSTYQAVSGAGKLAMDELWGQTQSIYNQKEYPSEAFSHQIAFNCIPQIDVVLDNGYTKEEYKVINESKKILNLPDLKVTCTAVRVPVFHCHAESVNVQLKSPLKREDLLKVLEEQEGVSIFHNFADYPMQLNCAGSDDVYVGRIREDNSQSNTYDLWVVADNLRKGAALNAVQIAELLLNV